MPNRPERPVIVALLCLASWSWYRWLAAPLQVETLSLVVRGLLGLCPITLAALLAGPVLNGRIWAHLAVAAGMLLGQPHTYFPHSPDMAFHLGKVLWASRGVFAIDPAMGIASPYPWIFHAFWGEIVRLTQSDPASLLRFASIFNVAGIIAVAALFARVVEPRDGQCWLPWLCCLPLIAKETAQVVLATPSMFSMPLAIAGWWGFATARSSRGTILSTLGLVVATAIWPGQLFAIGGVLLLLSIKQPHERWTRLLAFATAIALAIVSLTRLLAIGSIHASSETHLYPHWSVADLFRVARHILSLGGDANGAIVAVACILLTLALAMLTVLGLREARRSERLRRFPLVIAGLLLGTAGATWIMVQAAFWSRLASLTGFAMVPLAALGMRRLPHILSLRPSFVAWTGRLALGGVWLVPFLAASILNAERAAHWSHVYEPATNALRLVCKPSERVWASPETLTHVVMGQLPVFGFLGHRWSHYYAAPARQADSIQIAYETIARLDMSPGDTRRALRTDGVSYVVLSRSELNDLPLGRTLLDSSQPIWQDSSYAIFAVDNDDPWVLRPEGDE